MYFRKIAKMIITPKPRFSKPLFSKYLDLVNKLQLPSYKFYYIDHLDLVNPGLGVLQIVPEFIANFQCLFYAKYFNILII